MDKRRLLWILLVVFVLIFSFRIYSKITSVNKLKTTKIIPVKVMTPRIGEIQDNLILTGDIKGEKEVVVRPKLAGRVAEIYVKEGDFVKAGDKLLSYVKDIDASDEVYSDMVTFSPIDGFVGMQSVKEGDYVTSTVGLVNPIFTVYAINKVKIYAEVPEKNLSSVRTGTPVSIKLDAYPDKTFIGRVGNLRPVVDPLSRTSQVEIVLNNFDHKIKPGMFATVDLTLLAHKNTMILPIDSVMGLDQKYVYIIDNGSAKMKQVSTGILSGQELEITSGLQKTDQVIISGQRVVQDGTSVEAIKE